jgi:hypothetical protein
MAQRLGAALLVDQGAHERPSASVARPIEDGLREGAGSVADAHTVAIVCAGEQVDEAREGAGELERDGEEGADRRRGRRLALRGKEPPDGRLRRPVRRRDA